MIGWTVRRLAEIPPGDDWLGEAERSILEGWKFPKRRAEWRLGRWTAKHAVAAWLARDAVRPGLRSIEILPAPDGAPEARLDGVPAGLSLSLSHCDACGFAAVSPGGSLIGCDIERIEEREPGFAHDYFLPSETGRLEAAPPHDRDLAATLIWSAKESALKALREGLRRDTRSVEVLVEAHGGEVSHWAPLSVRCLLSGRVLHGYWRAEGNHIFTLAADPPAGGLIPL